MHSTPLDTCEPSEKPKQILQTNMNAKRQHHRANKKSEQKDAAATADDGGAVPCRCMILC